MSPAWATIIGAAVAAAASIIVCIINNNKQNALFLFRLEQLEKKVEKHNNLVERTYRLEESAAILGEKVSVANHRISDLENANKKGGST